MRILKQIVLLFPLFWGTLWSQTGPKRYIYQVDSLTIQYLVFWEYHQGDDRWGLQPVSDDSIHIIRSYLFKPEAGQIHWYRLPLQIKRPQEHQRILLHIEGMHAAYEVYWDGKIIKQNGKVGRTKAEEQPGDFICKIMMNKEWLKPGYHTLAIRFSNHHSQIGAIHSFKAHLTDLDYWKDSRTRILFIVYLQIGIFLCAALFSFALFLGGGRHRSYLILAIYCIVDVAIISYFLITYHIVLPITSINPIIYTQYILSSLSDLLLCIFFIFNFKIYRKKTHLLLLSFVVLGLTFSGLKDTFRIDLVEAVTRIYILGLLSYAVSKKISGSVAAFLGILTLVIPILAQLKGLRVSPYFYFDLYSFVYTIFIFCIILSISRQILEQNRAHQSALIRTHRLEAELLKKNIQPHFIMNTLLSIVSWIGEDHKKAIQLIQALAEEFRIVNKISSEREIPLSQEIHLCRLHLQLMGFRKDATYDLKLRGIDEKETIPPMIFHTLIENGLTHAYDSGESGHFTLSFRKENQKHHYTLKNDGSRLPQMMQKNQLQLEEGTGMKYVRTRLEERYGSRWEVSYGMKGTEWVVDIYFEKSK